MCRVHHRELHGHGNEAAWWQSIKIEPLPVAIGCGSTHGSMAQREASSRHNFRADLREGLAFIKAEDGEQPMTSFRQIEANRRNAAEALALTPKR